ncbi:hypothetical protein HMSSN036_51810 [Paenibacillus macerans]|nr:hypothetical protein HMSSN036_51810 [Paenibacillus macerans]
MKEAYYFSHDSNARHDPKITAMRGVYGSEGYGWYWMLVEMMRESEGYKLDMQSKYTFNAFALQLHADSKRVEQFIHDCIHEFNLFEADATHFWSASLLRRMNIREQKTEARRKAAKARWDKEKRASGESAENANTMQMHSNADANAMQGKERKLNKSKIKIKVIKTYIHLNLKRFGLNTQERLASKKRPRLFKRLLSLAKTPMSLFNAPRTIETNVIGFKRSSNILNTPRPFSTRKDTKII